MWVALCNFQGMKSFSHTVWLGIAAGVAFTAASQVHADIGYQLVTIGNPANAPDTAVMSDSTTGYGEVDYTYGIGKYDVTLSQYTTFLNAVAQSDPYGLYNTNLATDLNVAGISRNGNGNTVPYSYSVIGNGQDPVTYVSWFDAARFSNWLQNGQPTGLGEVAGSTEQGAYTLDGANSGIVLKNVNALYWIPSENEWYKAAYYDPTLNGGAGGYWGYATKSNVAPGNVVGSAINQANYDPGITGGYSVTQSGSYSASQNYLTPVGAFTNSGSYYGTFDQSGEVFQWNDSVIGAGRGVRGGSWFLPPDAGGGTPFGPDSSARNNNAATEETSFTGFRVASSVPEPSTVALVVGSGLIPLLRRRRTDRTT